ncbi:hypothetical protein LBMAG42_54960 [Deltaproteobacteria bacterium]|nr:hypothetical protein LBMAG42_54960 [Deltaproteobacteria bacterium]
MLLVLLAPLAFAEPLHVRGSGGFQADGGGHGEFDFGVYKDAWTAELYTDTLQVEVRPKVARGWLWTKARAEGAAAGLMISPWTDGLPDPTRARLVSTVGAEAGRGFAIQNGPGFTGILVLRGVFFDAVDGSMATIPGATLVETLDFGAYWRPDRQETLEFSLRAGVDYSAGLDAPLSEVVGAPVSPHALAELRWRPRWLVSPRVELRAGAAEGQGEFLRTRLGGDMPYQVPIAGAAWSEFWVEDYAAARLGVSVGSADAAPQSGAGNEYPAGANLPNLGLRARGTLFVDLATFDDTPLAWGVGGRAEVRLNRWWTQLELGWGGGVPRPEGVVALAGMVRVGVDWTPLGVKAPPKPTEPASAP